MVGVKLGVEMNKRGPAKPALVGLTAIAIVALAACSIANKGNIPAIEPTATAQNRPVEPPPKEPIGVEKNGIRLVYPHDASKIAAPSTFFAGAIPPGSTLTLNGQAVKVNAQGFYAHVMPLAIGTNRFTLTRDGDPAKTFSLSITRPVPPKPVPASPAQFLKSSIEPKQDIGAQPGDLVQFGVRGSPGSQISVKLGGKTISLSSRGSANVKRNLDTTFGVQFQQSPNGSKDFYTGFYRVNAGDNFQAARPEFVLVKNGVTVREKGPATITVLQQPFVATTTQAGTIVRVGPGAGRTTPFVEGVRVLVDGFVGNSYRVEVAPGKHLWIEKDMLAREEGAGEPPRANVRTINIENESSSSRGGKVVIPLNQRLPYEVRQEVSPANKLILKVYGATADTDWITEPTTSSTAVQDAAEHPSGIVRNNNNGSRNPVSDVTWQQLSDGVYQVTVNVSGKQQWGYWVDYDGTNLQLHIKSAPNVALAENSLRGLRICVDPGHGGRETGAIGLSGIKESTINLAISRKLERILRDLGADVIMTRTEDVDVSLGDRVAKAIESNADLLVSVHNNSLPDGRNPWTEHGTSTYYYHPQSKPMAIATREGLVSEVGFKDYNTRWQNLALARPTNMPATLTEAGFVINPDEYALLISNEGQERVALGIARGIRNFLSQALGVTPSPQ